MKEILKNIMSLSVWAGAMMLASCESFVDLGAPPTQVEYRDAFTTDASASTVVRGLYVAFAGNFNNQNLSQMTSMFTGIAADELQYNGTDVTTTEFATNNLLNLNSSVANLWSMSYQLIKNANNAITGLESSTSLTASLKNQLIGEAKFMRAYVYFYLVNLYGGVPLNLLPDNGAFESAKLPRASADEVYGQIVNDLRDAEDKLEIDYKATPRGRVNKHAASALLSRVYLYSKDYPNAELYAGKIISATQLYSLTAPTANFINSSAETILQIANLTAVTTFGFNYVTAGATSIPNYTLLEAVYNSFETTPAIDLRRSNWIVPKVVSNTTYYTISKYKAFTGTGNEYHILLRLSEQYLIRAEARAYRDNLSGAKADIDAVRTRAGLGGVSSILTKEQMLEAIETERLHELFGEYGHRWLDLKRTGRATTVLSAIKTDWKETDALFPIPESQRLQNKELGQNPGYEN
ncbi:RagB/SusD family nutrient uptake outer membrane protein [Sphingobacterium faecale]|uniref:RagB/SusD family nutrient uptake outer membrane protein n=1 Tax=Sphingobacterium faecale TaxID=2803775 RepID=A0ABS1QZX4_9SPHI|nr:RagB/SusD family nutrient uptake outer membrane protein [Sphingobacterium faecale]MBL1407201.1 RagB/SusD family nutrient uptake outer membrane protein [Sphingobacterium faecale]